MADRILILERDPVDSAVWSSGEAGQLTAGVSRLRRDAGGHPRSLDATSIDGLWPTVILLLRGAADQSRVGYELAHRAVGDGPRPPSVGGDVTGSSDRTPPRCPGRRRRSRSRSSGRARPLEGRRSARAATVRYRGRRPACSDASSEVPKHSQMPFANGRHKGSEREGCSDGAVRELEHGGDLRARDGARIADTHLEGFSHLGKRLAPRTTAKSASQHMLRIMAKAEITFMTDDLDGSEATEAVTFALRGVEYAIDLNAKHVAALEKALAKYVRAGRTAPRRAGRRPARSARSRGKAATIRTWAAANGFSVGTRGRIPAEVTTAFHTAAK